MPEPVSVSERLRGDTGRLAATYLAIIMGLTLVFSGVIYAISSSQFDRPFPPRGNGMMQFDDSTRSSFQDLLDERADQARAELLSTLILLNLTVLVGGAFFSYMLARKSLEPIEAAMESQARFVSDASHELRTPLTALQVTNEVALRKKKLNIADAKDLIAHNLAETIKLRNLSEALLGLARQESADTAKQGIALADEATQVIGTVQPLAESRSITILNDIDDVSVVANRAAVSQVLSIYLDNAIKYAPESSQVTVTAANIEGETQLLVHDDGDAIPAKYHDDIFKRFYRIDESRSSQHTEGNGLGLSIAQAIATRHGYRVSLSTAKSRGNTFILHIPAA